MKIGRGLAVLAALSVLAVVLGGCNPEGTPQARSELVWGVPECQVGIVGDSLVEGARDIGGLTEKFQVRGCEVVNIDAKVSRHSTDGAAIVEAWAAAGMLPRILVVALGTNECSVPPFAGPFLRILAAAGPDRPIIWVNTWRPGCDTAINDSLFAFQKELNARPDMGNVWILNHWQWVYENRGVLARDGIHLNSDGYRGYADRIVAAVLGT
ncbi:MAG: hypothetical protein ACK5O2_14395 [Microthrixaceae bacterium]